MSTNDAAATDLVTTDTETTGRSQSVQPQATRSTGVRTRQTAEYASMRRVMGRFV